MAKDFQKMLDAEPSLVAVVYVLLRVAQKSVVDGKPLLPAGLTVAYAEQAARRNARAAGRELLAEALDRNHPDTPNG